MIRSIAEALDRVCHETGVTTEEILGRSRSRSIAHARQDVCRLAHECGASYPEIGRALGIDHSTALHGARVASERARQSKEQE